MKVKVQEDRKMNLFKGTSGNINVGGNTTDGTAYMTVEIVK